MQRRMNMAIAGYHILMIMSAVDYKFSLEEDKIIREYLFQQFPFKVNLDKEMEIISNLKHDEWHLHFHTCVDDFYNDSTPEERNDLLKFALYLAKADEVITEEENSYLQYMFNAWDHHKE